MNFGLIFAFLALLFCNCCLSLMQEQANGREIKHFAEFLEQHLNRTVLSYTFKRLTKPGDNFGSVLQSVDVRVTDGKNEKRLNLVIKIPVTTDELIAFFQPSITFVKETAFYANIIPAIEEFERIQNIPKAERLDIFIPCVAFRNSLNSSAEVADQDAVLVLENMKTQNYRNLDRMVGMNSGETIGFLKDLAKFHATNIAMRRLQPELFNTNVRPYLKAITRHSSLKSVEDKIKVLSMELKNVGNISAEMINAIERSMNFTSDFYDSPDVLYETDTPYTTVVHSDLWINNIMMKKVKNVTKFKIYDFQKSYCGSFVHDLTFFFLTSVQPRYLRTNFKLFIEQYHTEFVKTLSLAKCPLDEYTFEKMWNEIQGTAKFQLIKAVWRAKLIYGAQFGSTESIMLTKLMLEKWKAIIDLFNEYNFF